MKYFYRFIIFFMIFLCISCGGMSSDNNNLYNNIGPILIKKSKLFSDNELIKIIKNNIISNDYEITNDENKAQTIIEVSDVKMNLSSTIKDNLLTSIPIYKSSSYKAKVTIIRPSKNIKYIKNILVSLPVVIISNQNIFSNSGESYMYTDLEELITFEVEKFLHLVGNNSKLLTPFKESI